MTHEDAVLQHIKQHGPVESNDIVAALEGAGIPRTTTFAYLSALHKSGSIQRTGRRRHYVYYVTQPSNRGLAPGDKIKVKWDDGKVYTAKFQGTQGDQIVAWFPSDKSTHHFPADWVQA